MKSALALASLYQQSALGKLSEKAEEPDADGLRAAVLAARKALKDSRLLDFKYEYIIYIYIHIYIYDIFLQRS